MIPVQQTIDRIPGGDCFRACVASVLEMKIDDVPHFCEDGKHDGVWYLAFRDWLKERGLCAVTYDWTGSCPPQGMIGHCLVSVQSKHPDAQTGWLHSVVGKSWLDADGLMALDIVHDPNGHRRRNEWGHDEIKDVIWIVKVI